MTRQCVLWNPVICQTFQGTDYGSALPDLIAKSYRGTLVTEIISMPLRNPIAFEKAVNLIDMKIKEACKASKIGHNPGEYFWYHKNFVQCISDMGFHIELSGEEFEFPLGELGDC